MEPLRVGLLGVGKGQPYLRACLERPDIVVTALCDRDVERLGEAAQAAGVQVAVTDSERLFVSGKIDAVVVATPERLHRRHVATALEHGLHVYVVGPATATLEDGLSLLAQAARTPARRVMVGHPVRFRPLFAAVRELIAAGELGDIYGVRIGQYAPPPDLGKLTDPQALTPPILGVGYHALDLARWLGGELAAVRAGGTRGRHKRLPFDDTVSATFGTAAGGLAQVFLTLGARRPPSITLEVCGTEGFVSGSLGSDWNVAWTMVDGALTERPLPSDAVGEGLSASLGEFVAAIRENRPPAVNLTDGLHAVAAASAACQAAASGATVSVPPIEPRPA